MRGPKMSEWTSNTEDAVRACVGHKIVGVLFNACPVERADLAAGNKTLVFEDGSGMTFSSGGGYWRERADEIRRAVEATYRDLDQTRQGIEGISVTDTSKSLYAES